jgi:hypothetical protein
MAHASAVVIPLIADEQVLAEALHKMNPTCKHASVSPYKECEQIARNVFRTGVVKSGEEFIHDMKDMPGVKRILNEALREAWQEGYDSLISGNPYDTEEE